MDNLYFFRLQSDGWKFHSGSSKTCPQTLRISSHQEGGLFLFTLNLGEFLTALTTEYGRSDAMWLPMLAHNRLYNFWLAHICTHGSPKPPNKTDYSKVTMLWRSPIYIERLSVTLVIDSIHFTVSLKHTLYCVIIAQGPDISGEATR